MLHNGIWLHPLGRFLNLNKARIKRRDQISEKSNYDFFSRYRSN